MECEIKGNKQNPQGIWSSCFGILQKIGKSFMFPIALLPFAGLLLGIGAAFTQPQMINAYGLQNILGDGTFLNAILIVMRNTGSAVFANLPIIFAIGVALGMANYERSVAALSSAIAFLTMHEAIHSLLQISGKLERGAMLEGTVTEVCGIKSLDMGVFGGIIVGIGVAYLHNKFYKIKFPNVISFFGGVRFVPIISTFTYIFVGAVMFFAWPWVQVGMHGLGSVVLRSKYAGSFIYGLIERALIPFGLHHVFYMPFWQTNIGGMEIVDGICVSGAQNIFFAQLASLNVTKFSVESARFMSGKFPFMMFGLPGAALAMYVTAKPNKRKAVGGLLLSAAITAMLTGITEPIEFTFLFVAPVLYILHCILAGFSFMIMHFLNVAVGMTFSGGLIDFLLFGVVQGNSKTNWIYVIPVGIAYFAIYFFVFKFMIKKCNFITPGREDDNICPKLFTRTDFEATKLNKNEDVSELIVEGLGGAENIDHLDCCATRLRVKVRDTSKVNDALLKESGSVGVIKKGDGVQVVYGPRVTVIKSALVEFLGSSDFD